jgi:hypothetical protein
MKAIDPQTHETVYVCCPNCGCDDIGEITFTLATGITLTLCECRRCIKTFVPLYPPWAKSEDTK